MSFFASTKPVKIDPELSMLVKHLISNGYAEFKIRLISAKASASYSRLTGISSRKQEETSA